MNRIIFDERTIVKFLFYFFPVPFILGNLIVTLHLFIFIIFSLILITKNKFKIRIDRSCWLLIFFFSYLFLSTILQFQLPGIAFDVTESWDLKNKPFVKSFFLFRFLILIFILDTLFFNKILNLKKLLLISAICTTFISFDILLQYFSGTDLFGFESFGSRNSGPFGDEFIAGGYLLKFSFLSFFYIFQFFKNEIYNKILLALLIFGHATAILLSGNRMPMILFLFTLFITFILLKNFRISITAGLILFVAAFFAIGNNDAAVKNPYLNFVNDINIIKHLKSKQFKTLSNENKKTNNETETINENDKKNFNSFFEKLLPHSGHGRLYSVATTMWLDQPLFGFGLKSFRVRCHKYAPTAEEHLKMGILPYGCSSHPHNYYLEILVEAGLLGGFLILFFYITLIKDFFYYIKTCIKSKDFELYLLIPIILMIFIEIWPVKSTGSFFTTANATYFWLLIAIFISKKKI